MAKRVRPKVAEIRRGLYVVDTTLDRLNEYRDRLKVQTGKRQLSQSKAIDHLLDLAERLESQVPA